MNLEQALLIADKTDVLNGPPHECESGCKACALELLAAEALTVLATEVRRVQAIEEKVLKDRESIRRMSARVRANSGE